MIEPPVEPIVRSWLPQRFGSGKASRIVDPLIEPLWIGERVLVRLGTAGNAEPPIVVAADGTPLIVDPPLVEALLDATRDRATSAVLDGYLTRQATRTAIRHVAPVDAPTFSDHAARMVVGERRNRRSEASEDRAAAAEIHRDGAEVALVLVDLLEVDGSVLLEVPLLERKRLLESVVAPGELVRIGPYVRPPVEGWIGTWRAAGFVEIAYKAANSRYLPGVENPDWATARLPRP